MTKKTEMRTETRKPFSQFVDFEMTRISSHKGGIIQGKGGGLDLSSKGLGLITENPLKAGEILKLHLPSHSNGISIPVLSEVRWAKLEGNRYRVGILFIS